ncbi:MAG: 3-deoxy-D-manno-octulosonic acid transferase [Candidatus Zipacnadales bacterium]
MRHPETPLSWRYYAHAAGLVAASPLIAAAIAWRLWISGKPRDDFAQRFGRYPDSVRRPPGNTDPVIWIHAVSVGEVATAHSIIAELRKKAPLARIILSTTTLTGREAAQKRGLGSDGLVFFPIDLPFWARRALDTIQPDLFVTIDTELWPTILELARARGIRTAVANARFSDKGLRRARFIRWWYRWMLSNVDAVLAQSELDAERYIQMGAPPERVEVTGSIKFDEDFPQVSPAAAAKLRQDLGLATDIPVWVVGSTREGEEEYILDAFHELHLAARPVQLIIAPRHPERGSQVERLVRERGYQPLRRTQMASTGLEASISRPERSVVILDTIGELARVYAIADIVTVGGSFVPWGGHNMLQPMAQGKPVVFGPYTHNFRDIVHIATEAGAAVQLTGPQELATTVARILSSEAEAQLLSLRALKVVRENRGASARTASRLIELLNSTS